MSLKSSFQPKLDDSKIPWSQWVHKFADHTQSTLQRLHVPWSYDTKNFSCPVWFNLDLVTGQVHGVGCQAIIFRHEMAEVLPWGKATMVFMWGVHTTGVADVMWGGGDLFFPVRDPAFRGNWCYWADLHAQGYWMGNFRHIFSLPYLGAWSRILQSKELPKSLLYLSWTIEGDSCLSGRETRPSVPVVHQHSTACHHVLLCKS